MGSGQRVDELQAGLVGPEDIGREADVRLRALDGGDHFRIGLIAAFENRVDLAGRDALSGDHSNGRLEALERIL